MTVDRLNPPANLTKNLRDLEFPSTGTREMLVIDRVCEGEDDSLLNSIEEPYG